MEILFGPTSWRKYLRKRWIVTQQYLNKEPQPIFLYHLNAFLYLVWMETINVQPFMYSILSMDMVWRPPFQHTHMMYYMWLSFHSKVWYNYPFFLPQQFSDIVEMGFATMIGKKIWGFTQFQRPDLNYITKWWCAHNIQFLKANKCDLFVKIKSWCEKFLHRNCFTLKFIIKSWNYPPSFLFCYLEKLERSLVYSPKKCIFVSRRKIIKSYRHYRHRSRCAYLSQYAWNHWESTNEHRQDLCIPRG